MQTHLSKAETAKRLGVSERTVQRWMGRTLRTVKLGRLVRIAAVDLDAFLSERTLTPTNSDNAGTANARGR